MSGRLAGRSCLIVGGTGGIGLATARRFVAEGARVAIAGLPPLLPDDLAAEIGPPDRVARFAVDVESVELISALFREVLTTLGGRLDALVHVAGISGRRFGDGPIHECSVEGWDRVMAANARGAFLTNREATRVMLTQDRGGDGLRGCVVNLGSALAEAPSPEHFATVAYAASKGAIRSLTIASAARYAADGLRFNLIEPGLIATPMSARATGDPSIAAYLTAKQPLRAGPGSAEDVAEAALYLSEPASRFVTGVVLRVDGGWGVSDGREPASPKP